MLICIICIHYGKRLQMFHTPDVNDVLNSVILFCSIYRWRRQEIEVISRHQSRQHLSTYVEVGICLLVFAVVPYFLSIVVVDC